MLKSTVKKYLGLESEVIEMYKLTLMPIANYYYLTLQSST